MNAAHIHLIINHIPLLTIPMSLIVYAYGRYNTDEKLQRFSLLLLVATAATVVPVYLTGEPAEKIVEHIPGVLEPVIEAHEEAAEISLAVTLCAGLVAGLSLFLNRYKQYDAFVSKLVVVTSLVAVISLGYTSNLGGKIRHSEVQGVGAVNAPVVPQGDQNDDD